MSMKVRLILNVNGRRYGVRVPAMKRLLDVLREDCGLTGSKEGCGEGECGACSVLMDGASVCSCLVAAAQAEGAKIVTVEGLAKGRTLSRLQQSFVEHGAAQCGICTPGMLITSVELLERVNGRVPGDAEVREALAGNLCRCTGYQKIVDAVRAAARASAPRRAAAPRPKRARKPGGRTRRKAARTRTPRRAARRTLTATRTGRAGRSAPSRARTRGR